MELIKPDSFTNYYDVLEVSPHSSLFEIYQGYLKVKKSYSLRNPEMFKNFTFDEIQDLLTLIEEAYATIGQQETRNLYDIQFFHFYPHLKAKLGNLSFIEAEPQPFLSPERPQHTTPTGYGKTAYSSYELDEAFEAQIHNQEYFDGVFLGKIRKYKQVKIEDFSQKTCISLKYLYAIEDNNYNALPAAVFTRGYILQYCKILELDADKVSTTFMKLYQNGRD